MKLLRYSYRFLWFFLYLIYKVRIFKGFMDLKMENKSCSVLGNGSSLIHQLKKPFFLFQHGDAFVVNDFVSSLVPVCFFCNKLRLSNG